MFLAAVLLAIVSLEPGLSDTHWKVTTRSAEAQQYFDQGLRYIYGFHHEQAIASFQRAAELDPSMPMAYWGTAYALGPNINLDVDPEREKQAYDTVQSALGHLDGASEKERDLIRALEKRYSNNPDADLKALAVDYSKAMGEVSKKYPDDLDIATLYAESLMDLRPWKFWTHDGQPNEGTLEIVGVLESVLKRNPKHLGANHYYIHAVEASQTPQRALASAKQLQTLAPNLGHLVHMPAHILHRTGDYAGAAKANEVGAAADRRFMEKHGHENIYSAMYYNHNLQFGSASHAMQGRFDPALKMASEMAEHGAMMAKEMPMVESITAAPLLVLVRFGKWTDVIRAPLAEYGPHSTAASHFARGVAFAGMGNIAGAQTERRMLEEARAKLTDDPGMLQNSPKNLMTVAANVLDARIALASGDRASAIASYKKAIETEDQLNYDEPPNWFYPVRESLGATLLRDGKAAEAEAVFRADLAKNPKNPRSLFGLAKALRAQQKSAASAEAEFRKMWKGGALKVEDL
ncbi:MAG: tetratricopeptide repeat protein [Acidobacteria bacterium]|nr:tetratricopeptide repeat protein [Acidobacteriota bacterium]